MKLRISLLTLCVCFAVASAAPIAGGQALPAGQTAPSVVPPPATEQAAPLQFTVDVLGRLAPVYGAAGDHVLSFSAPVHIPGVTLGSGTYIFRVVAPSIMQVVSEDRAHSYAMFFVNSATRAMPTGRYEVRLERVEGGASRLGAMFLPNGTRGYEVVYSRIPNCERTLRAMNLPTVVCVS